MGWNFSCQIARYQRALVITRKNNRENIEKYRLETGDTNSDLKFYYYDLPYLLRFWKKGSRGASLYFYLWQLFLPIFILTNKLKFDIAHNLNFHADSYPSMLWVLGKPLVWGPINHNEKIPSSYIKNIYGYKDYIRDRAVWSMKNVFWYLDPLHFLSRYMATKIIGANSSVQTRLRISDEKFIISPSAASDEVLSVRPKKRSSTFQVLVIGRFITIKAFDIALLAFDDFYNGLPIEVRDNVKLTILGRGPKKTYLFDMAKSLSAYPQISFLHWLEKVEVDQLYENADVFFFPSHEGAGMVVPEALSHAIPILCFDNFGPGEFVDESCSLTIPYTNYHQSVKDFSKALSTLFQDKLLYESLSKGALETFKKKFNWNSRGESFKDIYNSIT